MAPEYRKTCRRLNEAGHAHSLTFSCFQRRPFLLKDRTRNWFLESLERTRTKLKIHVWAYVIMPEHVHLLIFPLEKRYSISHFLSSIKQSVSKRAVSFVQSEAPQFLAQMTDLHTDGTSTYRFWQRGGGYDRNLTEPQAIWNTMEYIHANPVRRGLCKQSTDWAWSSAREWEHPGAGPLSINRDSVPKTQLG